KVTKVSIKTCFPFVMSDFSELGDFGEIEVAHLHRGNHHIKTFLAAGPHRPPHLLDRFQHIDQALIEAKISYAVPEFAVLDQESTIASHAGEDFFVWIDL